MVTASRHARIAGLVDTGLVALLLGVQVPLALLSLALFTAAASWEGRPGGRHAELILREPRRSRCLPRGQDARARG
jgi:hypothetical protein